MVGIKRLQPRGGVVEAPLEEMAGFKLADPKYGNEMHHARRATHVRTLKEAADLIEKQGFSIWITQQGKRASLICPANLKITHG